MTSTSSHTEQPASHSHGLRSYSHQWFGNIRRDILAGILVAFALIPEAIGFSLIAGVDPKVGLYASFAIACVSAFLGGRPGMISAATAATAVVMVSLVRDHGLEYLFAATILMGLLQMGAGFLRLGRIMRFVSRSVITGFVNALAILIFMAQLPELIGVPMATYGMVAAGLAIIYLFPLLTKAVPSPLVAIAVLTLFAWYTGMDLRTVGDLGELPSSLPILHLPQVPLTLETLQIIFPYSVTLAAVGLLESLLTSQIVDDMTDTMGNKSQECIGQGAGNMASALIGGMGGCAMIGQSVINVSSGGRGRLSTFIAGAFLLFLILVLDDLVRIIPMAALVAVMIMVSIGTFSWRSILDLRRNPRSSSIVMLATVATVVGTHDLAQGVLVGVLLSGVFFAGKVSRMVIVSAEDEEGRRVYRVTGQIFFASSEPFLRGFDFEEAPETVVIDVTHAHFWDITAVGALDRAVMKFRQAGARVEVLGLNEASATMVDRFALHDKGEDTLRATH
ncbi:SulP family inorganic anion transporter [Xanthobacter sp. TB0139]|uniref:SulP family inorganic anion transporter n=1 Tax=Xanthobacter sp. TB0139 TaxID=3459178 RepID=UPI00403A78D1